MLIWSLLSTGLTPEFPGDGTEDSRLVGAGCLGWPGLGGMTAGVEHSLNSRNQVREHLQSVLGVSP